MITELISEFDNSKSFYKKAFVKVNGNNKKLYSYGMLVAEIINNQAFVYMTYSKTTLRHIKEFLKQNNFKAENKAQIEKNYIKEVK